MTFGSTVAWGTAWKRSSSAISDGRGNVLISAGYTDRDVLWGNDREFYQLGVLASFIGTGTAGYSDQQVNDPYGIVIGPDGALYFCDLGNQRIRRLDLKTRRTSTIAGSGRKGYDGDQGPALDAALNIPHEIQFDRAGNLYIA